MAEVFWVQFGSLDLLEVGHGQNDQAYVGTSRSDAEHSGAAARGIGPPDPSAAITRCCR